MSYTFDCVFSGLCGFVLNKPLRADPPPTRARVLIPEGDVGAFREKVSVHRPMLLIPAKNIRPGGRIPDFILQVRSADPIAVYFLNGLELTFDFHAEGLPAGFAVNSAKVLDPENPEGDAERTSFEMIADIERGAADARTVHPSCLSNPPARERVEARVLLTDGKLFVRSLIHFVDPITHQLVDEVWEFKKSGGSPTFSQVLAEDVVLEKEELSSDVDLVFNNLDDSSSLAFKLKVGPAPLETLETKVEITVLNSELEGLLGLQSFVPNPRFATDIKLIYRLSTAWDGISSTAPVLPIPRRRIGGIGRPINCPRTSFVDDPAA
jgi:hypothetical protein